MRLIYLMGFLTLLACEGPNAQAGIALNRLMVSLAQGTSEARPVLMVTITNTSQSDVCVRAELMQNPYSYAMDLRLRDSKDREIKQEKPGFLSPPIMDPVRIAPGHSVSGRYYLDARFKLKLRAKSFLEGMSAKAAFRYDDCDGSQSQRIVSDWQRI